MYFKNICKALGTTGTEQDESKYKLQEIVPSVALRKFISVFQSQLRSFIVPIQFRGRGVYIQNNIFVSKWMGLKPGGGL